MKSALAAIAFALVSLDAFAAQAYLVRQSPGRSVTGQAILICTYRYGNQEFDRAVPLGSACAPMINIQ